jgi:FAD binding domain in molybdopterin dehydrogenase
VIRIGAMTRQRRLEADPVVAAKLPLLREALRWVGHLPTRSRMGWNHWAVPGEAPFAPEAVPACG